MPKDAGTGDGNYILRDCRQVDAAPGLRLNRAFFQADGVPLLFMLYINI